MRFLFQKTSSFREQRLIYEEVASNNFEHVKSQSALDNQEIPTDAQQIKNKIDEHMNNIRKEFNTYASTRPKLESSYSKWSQDIEKELNGIQKKYLEESSHIQNEEIEQKQIRIKTTITKIDSIVSRHLNVFNEKIDTNKDRNEMLNKATTELDSILDQDTKILYFSQMELMLQNDQDRLVLKKMLGTDLYRMFMILHTNKDLSKLNSRDKNLYKRFIMRYGGGGDGKDSARGFVSQQELNNPGLETPIRIEALRRLRRLNRQNKLPKWIDNEAINILHKPNYTPSGTSGVTYLKNGVSWEASRVLTAAFGLTFGANVISSKANALSNPWVVPSAFGTYVSYKSLEMGGFTEAWEWLKTTEGQRMNAAVDKMKQSDPEFLKWIYMEQDSEVESYFDIQKKSNTRKAFDGYMQEHPYKKEITNTDMRNIGARQEIYMGEESAQHYQYRYKMFQKLKEWGITTKNKKAFKQLVGVKIPMTFAYAKARHEVNENYESKSNVEKQTPKQNQSRPDIQSSSSSAETIKNQEVAKSPELSDEFKDFYKKQDALRPYLSLLINDVDFAESFKKQVEAIESGKKTPDSLITAENIMTPERKLLITATLLEMSKENRITIKDIFEKLFKGADADYLKKAIPVLAEYIDISDGIGNDLVDLARLHQANSDVLNAIGYVLAEANIIQSFDTLVSKVVGAEKTGKILDHITQKSPKFLYDIAHTQLTSHKYDGLNITPSRILLHMTNPEIGKNAKNINEFGEVLHYVYSTESLISSTGLDHDIKKKLQSNIDDYKGFAKNKAETIIRDMIDDYSDVVENKDGLAFILVHCYGVSADILEKDITVDVIIREIQKSDNLKDIFESIDGISFEKEKITDEEEDQFLDEEDNDVLDDEGGAEYDDKEEEFEENESKEMVTEISQKLTELGFSLIKKQNYGYELQTPLFDNGNNYSIYADPTNNNKENEHYFSKIDYQDDQITIKTSGGESFIIDLKNRKKPTLQYTKTDGSKELITPKIILPINVENKQNFEIWKSKSKDVYEKTIKSSEGGLIDTTKRMDADLLKELSQYSGESSAINGEKLKFEQFATPENGYTFAFTIESASGVETWYLSQMPYYKDQYPTGMKPQDNELAIWKKGSDKLIQNTFSYEEVFKNGAIDFQKLSVLKNVAEKNRESELSDTAKQMESIDIPRNKKIGYIGLVDKNPSNDSVISGLVDDVRYFPEMVKEKYHMVAANGEHYIEVESSPKDILITKIQEFVSQGITDVYLNFAGHGSELGVWFETDGGGDEIISPKDLSDIFNSFPSCKFYVNTVACQGGGFAYMVENFRDRSSIDGRIIMMLQTKSHGTNQEGRIQSSSKTIPDTFSTYYNVFFHEYIQKEGYTLAKAHMEADKSAKKLIPSDAEIWKSSSNGGMVTRGIGGK